MKSRSFLMSQQNDEEFKETDGAGRHQRGKDRNQKGVTRFFYNLHQVKKRSEKSL